TIETELFDQATRNSQENQDPIYEVLSHIDIENWEEEIVKEN
ncbi:3905_t:CDS:1, partial [Acaulospora colombiana]